MKSRRTFIAAGTAGLATVSAVGPAAAQGSAQPTNLTPAAASLGCPAVSLSSEIQMFKLSLMTSAILSSVIATAAAASPDAQFFPAENGRPFSAAVRIGNSVYISGVLGAAPDGTLPTDFAAQATNAMQAVADQLKLAGASMNDVYRCNVSLSDMKNAPSFNAVYVKHFKPERLPVRMAVAVSGLARGAAVEVECDAYVP